MATNIVPGQRWISEAEPQLGLGTILKVDHRMVSVLFLATGETRNYAIATAPLGRVAFKPGDEVQSHEGWKLTIDNTYEQDGVITYEGLSEAGEQRQLPEGELNNYMQLNRPIDRLFSGQIDPGKWFSLRYNTLQANEALHQSPVRGLTGSRTDLLPHQVYIANEVAKRYAPRVLLADEVGLGKTIEAGMIIHNQLLSGLAQRILVIVPETLIHQWLVEMIRRFNLQFSIFDEERCTADEESSQIENPFHNEQLIICSSSFLSQNPKRQAQALEGSWDMLVVDEAHHLQWTPQQSSPEYDVIDKLSRVASGVLLLTATPEQLGKEGHFARLRLLDPSRFHNLDAFREEEKHYAPIADAIESIFKTQHLPGPYVEKIAPFINSDEKHLYEQFDQLPLDEQQRLTNQLLDAHGTGRILFRNTRHAIKGFPQRKLHAYALDLPEEYRLPLEEYEATTVSNPQTLLSPELLYKKMRQGSPTKWTRFDPRVFWLANKLKTIRSEKALLITSNKHSALELSQHLREKYGIISGIFHEDMNLVERDRAASFFSDPDGTQVLVCSEIGSEGRNFQFAHHLILFDLPYNPDLLEQRIGRLDRIGQTHTIQIHVPYLDESAQAFMFRWYHEGLNAFEEICHVGQAVFKDLGDTLLQTLHQLDTNDDFDLLVQTTRALYDKFSRDLQNGRDKLLEYNSCRLDIANTIIDQIQSSENSHQLQAFMEQVFDCYGVEIEDDGEDKVIVRPNPNMPVVAFPGLSDDGVTITYQRETALHNEDVQFLTWEHPMVLGALDMIMSQESGNTCVGAIKTNIVSPGSLLLEGIFRLESERAEVQAVMPPHFIRVLLDHRGNSLGEKISSQRISSILQPVDATTAKKIVESQRDAIKKIIKQASKLANIQAPDVLETSKRRARELYLTEVERLKALQSQNPSVRPEEIDFFEQRLHQAESILQDTKVQLDAVRILVTTN